MQPLAEHLEVGTSTLDGAWETQLHPEASGAPGPTLIRDHLRARHLPGETAFPHSITSQELVVFAKRLHFRGLRKKGRKKATYAWSLNRESVIKLGSLGKGDEDREAFRGEDSRSFL